MNTGERIFAITIVLKRPNLSELDKMATTAEENL